MIGQILNLVSKLRQDYTTAKSAHLDANISSRAPASTAVSNADLTVPRIEALDELVTATLNSQQFTANGTFNVPTDYRGWMFATVVGGGGGGSAGNFNAGGRGGDGGDLVIRWPIWVDYASVTSLQVTVGLGGAGGSGTEASGSAGGFSRLGVWGNPFAVAANGGAAGVFDSNDAGAQGASSYLKSRSFDIGVRGHPFITGLYAAGGKGGEASNDGGGQGGRVNRTYSDMTASDALNSLLHDLWPEPATQTSPVTEEGGCGGDSWGMGDDWTATAPGYGGGGRGGDDNTGDGTSGTSGLVIVEWFT